MQQCDIYQKCTPPQTAQTTRSQHSTTLPICRCASAVKNNSPTCADPFHQACHVSAFACIRCKPCVAHPQLCLIRSVVIRLSCDKLCNMHISNPATTQPSRVSGKSAGQVSLPTQAKKLPQLTNDVTLARWLHAVLLCVAVCGAISCSWTSWPSAQLPTCQMQLSTGRCPG